jgi:hypothetical protein
MTAERAERSEARDAHDRDGPRCAAAPARGEIRRSEKAFTAPPFTFVDRVPSPPFAVSSGGPVLGAPIFVPMTFDGDPLRDLIEDAVGSMGCMSYWRSIVGDYGVGDAVMDAPVHMGGAAPSAMSADQVGAFIRNQIGAQGTQAGRRPNPLRHLLSRDDGPLAGNRPQLRLLPRLPLRDEALGRHARALRGRLGVQLHW